MKEEEAAKGNEFDFTMLSTFLACQKKYYYRIVRGLTGRRPPTAAEFGRVIHMCLDSWWKDKDDDHAIQVLLNNWTDVESDDKRTTVVGKKLLELYFDKYRSQSFKLLASELKFTIPIFEGKYNLIGRIDKIIDWDGPLYVVDHKTTSRLGYEFFYTIKPNAQFTGYCYAAKMLDYDVQGVMLDALLVAKGLTTPAQLARLNPLARDTSERTAEDFKRYFDTLQFVIADVERCHETGV